MEKIEKTDVRYPRKLFEYRNAPQTLYVEGNVDILNNKSIAIVGSRKCTEYGIKYASWFAEALSKNGITIISGLAIGIDSVAHEYSKNFKGKTIAILGSGLNKIYPKENKKLFHEILENGGCIISEYDINCEAESKNFPRRNRLISELSDGILVVEAELKSGSTITGNLGLRQKKKVFCIPRNLDETKGNGTNHLIKKGAKLVTSPYDIIEALGIKPEYNNQENSKEKISTKSYINDSYEQLNIEDVNNNDEILNIANRNKNGEILNINLVKEPNNKKIRVRKDYIDLYNLITYIPINIEVLSQKSNLNIRDLSGKLTMLELEGFIKNLPGNNYVRI